mmetsp:Transcript_12334/g.23960  ORF Transcript_12334/g.23960 Transcript_12334/m.23960 type:complete len:495 (-) Transcript_12334:468-1952(-)|eukprot:CAMPEP_0171494782 /NCGR_PEP_ID=MMETSP0958-20121227/5752_1 /TAXON_ID=87120 /ORGANISM="Aurantiochytrium limacinum, Strain ATCCMYA-1381" /LENGTH=494 /DNA_ID=CAMNT_0012028641 /DNA_START=684 /DNA_END=2168 /DNA_ORIENTATION=+
MSTIKEQVQRATKSFRLAHLSKGLAVTPPSILENARAVVFFKKLTRGRQNSVSNSGVFFKRISKEEWSNPVAVTMNKGDVYWGRIPRVERCDIFLIISDVEVVHNFELYGQMGFSDETNKMKKGILVENSEAGLVRFTEAISETPDMLRDDDNFSFGICDGHFFSVHIENPMIRVRDSSNSKFYGDRGATAAAILSSNKFTFVDQKGYIEEFHNYLRLYFDVAKRLPAYVALESGRNSPSSARSASSNSPSPDPAEFPAPQLLGSYNSSGSSNSGTDFPPFSTSHASSSSPRGPDTDSWGFSTNTTGSSSRSINNGNNYPSAYDKTYNNYRREEVSMLHNNYNNNNSDDAYDNLIQSSAPLQPFGRLDPNLLAQTSSLSISNLSSQRGSNFSGADFRSRGSSLGAWDSEGETPRRQSIGEMGSGSSNTSANPIFSYSSSSYSSANSTMASFNQPQALPNPFDSPNYGQAAAKYPPRPPSDSPPPARERVNSFDF